MKRAIVVVGVLSLAAILLLALLLVSEASRRHWCPKVENSEVSLDEDVLHGSSVYFCNDTYLVIWPEGHTEKAIHLKARKIGGIEIDDFTKFDDGLLSWHYPLQLRIGDRVHPDAVDFEEDPKLVVAPNRVEYRLGSGRIKVVLPKDWLIVNQ